MIRSVIVDADIVAYQAATACQSAVEWENDVWSMWGDAGEGFRTASAQVENIANILNATKLTLCFTDGVNWRKEIMPEYKLSRSKKPKPMVLKQVREMLSKKYETFVKPTLEGDDVMGILATHPRLLPGERIVVTLDKDLQGIPGLHVHMNDLTAAPKVVPEAEADHFHLLQSLSGDPTDGYPGCPGIGPKRAEAVLAGLTGKEAWAAIVAAYAKAGLNEEVALANARVARICRHTDFDFKTQRVKLWTP